MLNMFLTNLFFDIHMLCILLKHSMICREIVIRRLYTYSFSETFLQTMVLRNSTKYVLSSRNMQMFYILLAHLVICVISVSS